MKKEFLTEEMTKQEAKEGLNLFKKFLKVKSGVVSWSKSNPIEENAYISSGEIIGVYFPNTIFTVEGWKNYDLLSISKVSGRLGLVFALKDDASPRLKEVFVAYMFSDFDSLTYHRDMLEIKQKLERDRKDYENNLKVLNAIKPSAKKDGGEFEDVKKNFAGVFVSVERSYNGIISRVSFSASVPQYASYTIYWNSAPDPTIAQLWEEIEKAKEREMSYIDKINAEIKTLEKTFNKMLALGLELNALLRPLSGFSYYEDSLKTIILLGK